MTLEQYLNDIKAIPEIEKLFNGSSESRSSNNQDLLEEAKKYGLKMPRGMK